MRSFSSLLARVDGLALQHLGETVTYTSSEGEVAEPRGIFDAAYVKLDGGHAGISSSGPAIFLLLSGLPSDPTTDAATITRAGILYRIREAEPDGQGGIHLLLQEARLLEGLTRVKSSTPEKA